MLKHGQKAISFVRPQKDFSILAKINPRENRFYWKFAKINPREYFRATVHENLSTRKLIHRPQRVFRFTKSTFCLNFFPSFTKHEVCDKIKSKQRPLPEVKFSNKRQKCPLLQQNDSKKKLV